MPFSLVGHSPQSSNVKLDVDTLAPSKLVETLNHLQDELNRATRDMFNLIVEGGAAGEANTHSSIGAGLALTAVVPKVGIDLQLVSLEALDFDRVGDLITIDSGKWAEVSDLAAYLLLTGGTLTGGLVIAHADGLDVQDGAGNSALISYDANSFNIGAHALRSVYIGKDAGGSGSQTNNVAIGGLAGDALDAGQRNTFLGAYSGSATINGHNDTYIGYGAGKSNSAGTSNTIVGRNAGSGAGATYNNATMVGDSAGTALTTGANNLFFGYSAGSKVTIGSGNTIFGTAGAALVSGGRNFGVGANALSKIVSQDDNIGLGPSAGRYMVGKENIFIGQAAGQGANPSAGDYNVIIGQGAGLRIDSSGHVFIGHDAGARQTTTDDRLIIDNQDRLSEANELLKSLIVGEFKATETDQTLLANAHVVSNTYNFGEDGGSANVYDLTMDPAPNSYQTGMQITFIAASACTGAACTVEVNSLGTKFLVQGVNTIPAANYIKAGSAVVAVYDGTRFQMIQPAAQ